MAVTRSGPSMSRIAAQLKSIGDLEAKVGWFESATYPESGQPVAYIATIQEFGTGRIPARPFMRPAVADNGPEWMKALEDGARVVLAGGLSGRDLLGMVAARASGDVAKKIAAVMEPPLAPATIKARKNKSTKPLVDTGQLIQSVTWKLE